MGYNPFRWWTKGRPNKPLPADAPLLLKIRNVEPSSNDALGFGVAMQGTPLCLEFLITEHHLTFYRFLE